MGFADRFKRRQGLGAVTGYNGGSLQDQLDQPMLDGQPGTGFDYSQPNQPDVSGATRPRVVNPFAARFNQPEPLPQTDPAAAMNSYEPPMRPNVPMDAQPADTMTRPRTTNPFLDRLMNDPSRQERPREVSPTDDVTKSSDYIRQIADKPLSLRDKAGLVAQNIAVNLGGTPLATRRQRDIGRAQEGLQRDLAVQKARDNADLNQLVPFTLPDGSTTLVPARTVGALGSRQQGQAANLTERKKVNDAHVARWGQMAKNERAKTIMQEYNSGGLNGNPELLEQASKELGLNGALKDKFIAGQFRGDVDANGNLIEVNQQTNEAKPVTQTTTTGQSAPVQSFKVTQETKRDERARLGRLAAMDRAVVMARAAGARQGDPDVYKGMADEADADAQAALAQADQLKSSQYPSDKKAAAQYRSEAQKHQDRAMKLRELETKARGGQSPQGTMQTTAPKRQFNENAFRSKFQEKHGRQPTDAEIAPYRNAQ